MEHKKLTKAIESFRRKGTKLIRNIEREHGDSDEADKAWERLGALIRNMERACKPNK